MSTYLYSSSVPYSTRRAYYIAENLTIILKEGKKKDYLVIHISKHTRILVVRGYLSQNLRVQLPSKYYVDDFNLII